MTGGSAGNANCCRCGGMCAGGGIGCVIPGINSCDVACASVITGVKLYYHATVKIFLVDL